MARKHKKKTKQNNVLTKVIAKIWERNTSSKIVNRF